MTENRVAALFGGPAPADPVPDIVSLCERMLERAKTGELRALAFATVTRDAGGRIGSGWERADGERFNLAAAVMALHVRVSNDLANLD